MNDLFSEKLDSMQTVDEGYATEGGVGIITAVCYIVIGAIVISTTCSGGE
ncbi:hypothetical protein [Limibacterium fermenti]|jgi:hypothetical protein